MQHGLAGTRAHLCWSHMHQRCYNPDCESFHWYGARGIAVCERWNSLEAFLEDMGHPPAGMTIGRIDNDGDYEPGNCRWETVEEQLENYRGNRFLEHEGQERIIKLWAKEYDRDPRRVSERVRRGWSVQRALETPTPKTYEEAREEHIARGKAYWAANGARCRDNARARRRGELQQRPAEVAKETRHRKARPQPGPKASGRLTPEVQARIVELRAQGLACRAIAEQVPVSKSTVATVLARLGG